MASVVSHWAGGKTPATAHPTAELTRQDQDTTSPPPPPPISPWQTESLTPTLSSLPTKFISCYAFQNLTKSQASATIRLFGDRCFDVFLKFLGGQGDQKSLPTTHFPKVPPASYHQPG